jgi:hypothetical protein
MTTIFAIDPGPIESGYVVMRGGVISEHGIIPNPALKILLWDFQFQPCIVAIEMIACYGMAVGAEVFETCLWIGEFRGYMRPRPTTLCYRKDIKLHLCGTTTAKDANVRQALIDRLGPPGTKKNPGPTYGIKGHVWSALAVAVYAADQQAKLTNHPTT